MDNKKRYRSVVNLILFFLSILGFIKIVEVGIVQSIRPQWFNVTVGAIPMVVFGAIFVIARKGGAKSSALEGLSFTLAVLFLVFGPFNVLFMRLSNASDEITEVKYYNEIIKLNRHPASYKGIFPEEIPDNAIDAGLYEQPSYLRRRSKLYLYLQFNEDDYVKIAEELQDQAETIIDGEKVIIKDNGSYLEEVQYRENHYVSEDIIYKLSPNSHIGRWNYYIFSEKRREIDSVYHGYIKGAAVHNETNSIIYYGEQW